ncbi:uncharacterized protein LOC109831345 [Asparagus officinalis]|uniref:uncharacterized protein LOC109831345 n=1 Tax=Asparagus officinalis TaxID=4686 RepID=UPI00098E7F5E|nr:uncharacterized protein LOC109831345 [Asparagus officinalis]
MTFLFCKWLIAANIVTRRERASDSEEEAAPRQATEVTREARVSTRGKEAAGSSRKGKEPALATDSEGEFDSEETETSEGAGENESSSEEVSGLPDSFFDRGLVRPSVAPAQPQAALKKRKERVVMEYPNRMTVEVLSCDEEDEEDTVPLARRLRSQTSTQAQTQASPQAELRTKHRHEGSDARPLKKQKKAASKPRVHLPDLKETSGRSASSDEQGGREEGELSADAASPGGMETEETSYVQQMQDALKEEPAGVPPTPDVDPSATDADVPMHEPIEGEATHATKVDDFNDFDFNISEDDHQQILDSLLEKASGPATGSDVGIGSTEAGLSERPVNGTDTTINIETSEQPEGRDLVPWVGTEVNLQSSIPEFQPATPMDPMMIEVTVTPPDQSESPLKESLSLDPPSSEALVEKVPDVAGASTATIPEPILTVQESRLPSLGESSHAESSSVELDMDGNTDTNDYQLSSQSDSDSNSDEEQFQVLLTIHAFMEFNGSFMEQPRPQRISKLSGHD